MRSNYFVTVASKDVGGKTITEWQLPLQGALLGHGWLDNDTLFVAVDGAIADAIATSSTHLNTTDTFKAVTSSLQQPYGGYFYLDMDKTMSLVSRFPTQPQVIPPEASAIVNSIRGIAMTASSPDKSTSQIELLLALKPRKN